MANVLNSGFEVDLSSWTLTDTDASVTLTRDTATTNAGSAGSAKMVNTVAGADDHFSQQITVTPGEYQVTAWVNVTVFTAAALSSGGLWAQAKPGNVTTRSNITAATSGWEQRSVSVTVTPSDTSILIRLYAPQGTVFWDDVLVIDLSKPWVPKRMPLAV